MYSFEYAHSVSEKQPFQTFGKKLRQAREGSDHTEVSLAQFSVDESARWDLDSFIFGHSSVSRWEKGQFLPSLARFITLIRGCKKPASFFLKSLGLSNKEVCGHSFTEEEQAIIDGLNEERGYVFLMLWWILRHGTKAQADSIEESIDQFFKNVTNDEKPPWIDSLKKANHAS